MGRKPAIGKLSLVCLYSILFSAGCATKYQMLLKDGSEVIAKGRPETHEDGSVTYRGVDGEPQTIGRGWVYQIQPLGSKSSWGNSKGPDSSSYVGQFRLLPSSNGGRSKTEFLPRRD